MGTALDEVAPLAARVERARATLADPPGDACVWVGEDNLRALRFYER